MRYYLAMLTLLFATQTMAEVQTIAAIVNDNPITMQEFQSRRKMVMLFNKVGHLDSMQAASLNAAVLDGLVEEQLLSQQAAKAGIKVEDEEVITAIGSIEERNKMSKGQLAHQMSAGGIDYATFKAKIKSEILTSKVTSSSLASGLSVSPSEVDAAVLDTNSKDANIVMKVITGKDDTEKTYGKMISLRKKLPDSCEKLKLKSYQDFADLNDVTTKLSLLEPQIQAVVKDMTQGDHSDVIKVANSLKLFMVCSKKIENFTGVEANYVINFLGNKKLLLKTRKYMEDLRKRAYVKIFI